MKATVMTRDNQSERIRGYVLSCRDYGESDRIVTFFTGEKGKLKGIAKGARKSARRFSNSMELFCLSSFMFSRRRSGSLYFIENCDVIEHHPRIRSDIDKTLAASYFIELTDLFTEEEKPDSKLFRHLMQFLDLLEEGLLSESLLRIFELRVLALSGYDPALDHCARCGKAAESGQDVIFSIDEGGICCDRCRPSQGSSIRISPGTARTLLAGKNLPADRIRRLAFSAQTLRESNEILGRLIRHTLGKEPRSLGVFRQVRHLEKAAS